MDGSWRSLGLTSVRGGAVHGLGGARAESLPFFVPRHDGAIMALSDADRQSTTIRACSTPLPTTRSSIASAWSTVAIGPRRTRKNRWPSTRIGVMLVVPTAASLACSLTALLWLAKAPAWM